MQTLKQHPIAWSIYAMYLFCWLWIGYNAYFNFGNFADGQALGIMLFLFIMCGFLPYLVVTFLISEMSGEDTRPFYLLLVRLVLGSFPVVLIAGAILNFVTSYS